MKKIVGILLSFAMILSFSPSASAAGEFQSGSGTKDDPFVITSLDELRAVSKHSDAYFSLEADITYGDSNEEDKLTTSLCGGGFTGHFDGNRHTIKLAITGEDPEAWLSSGYWIGLFGTNGGTISDLNVTGSVTGSASYVGAIVGENHGTITGCTSSATVTLSGDTNSSFTFWPSAGGITGNNSGTISNCSASGTVTVGTGGTGLGYEIAAGGLIGLNDNGSGSDSSAWGIVSDSSASGTVIVGKNNKDVNKGGLIGRCNVGSITNCSATGDVPASSTDNGADNQGGLIGYISNTNTTISDCYATGNVTGGDSEGITRAGGLIGNDASLAPVSNCYATGNVSLSLSYDGSRKGEAGGLIGFLSSSTVQNSYSVGRVTCGSVKGKDVFLGGLIGRVSAPTVTGCYWNTNTSGAPSGVGSGSSVGTGLTTVQMTGAAASTNMSDLSFSTHFSALDNTALKWYYPQLTAFSGNPSTTTKAASLASVTLATPTLSALNSSSGTIFPDFSSDTTDYCVTVGGSVPSITLTPSTTVSGASIKVNNNSVSSGSESGAIDLSDLSKAITITVTSSDGTYRDYKLAVKRFTPVTGITGVPTTATAGTDLTLGGTVSPKDATNQSITWSVKDKGTTGATISGNKLSTTAAGTVTVTATITGGAEPGKNYTKDFEIKVNTAAPIAKILKSITAPTPVTGITNGAAKTAAALGLPSNVTLLTDNGTVSATVTWDVASCSYNASSSSAQTFLVSGTVTLPDGVVNTNNVSLKTSISVTVMKASSSSHGSGGSNGTSNATSNATSYEATVTGSDGSKRSLAAATSGSSIAVTVGTAQSRLLASGGTLALTMPIVTGATSYGVSLPTSSLSADAGGVLTMNTGLGSISFPSNMLSSRSGTTEKTAQITISNGSSSSLPDNVKAAIGDRPIIQLSLLLDGKQTEWKSQDARVTISIPYNPTASELQNPDRIVIWYLDGGGNAVCIPNGHYDASTGKVVFTTTHFSQYAVGYNTISFKDVSGWYETYVSYLAARGIINGTGDGTFSPNANITRAEFVTLLAHLSGNDLSAYTSSSCSDVATTDWYFRAVQWAYQNGIASGYDGKFSPNANITREQMAVMLYQYAKQTGIDGSDLKGKSIKEFSDYQNISNWAIQPIQWAFGKNIISGNGDYSFAPQANATRAQAAKMIAILLHEMIGS